jgi:hypothetical protein
MRSWNLLLPLIVGAAAFAQQPAATPVASAQPVPVPVSVTQPTTITVPAGTKIPLVLRQAISTKNARPGDPVYAATSFPVVANDHIVIPVGSYVQGVIDGVKRAGRVKGRAEVLVHFRTLILPSGYTVSLPGAVDSAPDLDTGGVKNNNPESEGKIQNQGEKGKDAGTIATTAGIGAGIGAAARGLKGAGIGAGLGAAGGLIGTLLTRGSDLRLEPGSTVDIVLERPITLDPAKLHGGQ